MEMYKIIREKTQWIKEGLISGNIIMNCNHNNFLTRLYKDKDFEELYDMIFSMFFGGLLLNYREDKFESLRLGKTIITGYDSFTSCNECGGRIHYSFNGKEITPIKHENDKIVPCYCTEESYEITFNIDFPTGELYCADGLPYLREIVNEFLQKKLYDLNSTKGLYEEIKRYSSLDIFHVYVGNTCPDVYYREKDKALAVGKEYTNDNIECDEDCFNCKKGCNELPLGIDSIRIAEICTDLWWTTIIDKEVYKKLLVKYFGKEYGLRKLEEVKQYKVYQKIKPGTYKCTFYKTPLNEDEKKPTIYANLNLIK